MSSAVHAQIPSVPVSAGSTMSFGSKRGAGAVLITAGEVTRCQLERDLQALNWVIKPHNMRKLLADWKYEIRQQKRTLWMITGTYTARSCALSVLQSSDSSATIELDVEVADVAHAKPSLEWWKQETDKTWIKYKDESGVVLFMSGIAFKTGFFRRSVLHAEHKRGKQHLYRDASTANLQFLLEDEQAVGDPLFAVVEPEYHGQRSEELEAELESMSAGSGSESDVSGAEEEE